MLDVAIEENRSTCLRHQDTTLAAGSGAGCCQAAPVRLTTGLLGSLEGFIETCCRLLQHTISTLLSDCSHLVDEMFEIWEFQYRIQESHRISLKSGCHQLTWTLTIALTSSFHSHLQLSSAVDFKKFSVLCRLANGKLRKFRKGSYPLPTPRSSLADLQT